MKSKKVKLGIVGCGATVSCMYGPVFKYLDNGEFLAAMDVDKEQLEIARDMYGAKRLYSNLDEMLKDSDIEGVIIGTPVFEHENNVIKLAKAGKHILCEKPLARDIDECDRMIKVCESSKVLLMTAFMKRFNKCFRRAKEIIESGELGDVFQVRVCWDCYTDHDSGWRDRLPTLGGVFQDHGSHVIDLCRWWLGEIIEVSGMINRISESRDIEDQAVAVYRHENGGISFLHLTRVCHRGHDELYEIYGTKGMLTIRSRDWSCTRVEPFEMNIYVNGHTVKNITPRNDWNIDRELKNNNHFLKELEHFCDCIINKKTPVLVGEDGRKAIEVVNATYLSSHRSERIRLPLKKAPELEEIFKSLKKVATKLVT